MKKMMLDTLCAIHSTKISGNFGPKLNGSVQSKQRSLKNSGPPFFKVDHVSQSDRSNAPPILLVARTITDRIGLHLVLLPLLITMVYL